MNGKRTRWVAALALTGVATLGSWSAASAEPSARAGRPPAPAAVAPAAFELRTVPTGPPSVTPCPGSDVIALSAELAGPSTSSDPRLAGDAVLRGHGLISTSTGLGSLDGTITITDPATGRRKLTGRITQVVSQGGTRFSGLVTGRLHPSGDRVVATYSGADGPDGTVTAVGADSPVPPGNAGVVLTGVCGA